MPTTYVKAQRTQPWLTDYDRANITVMNIARDYWRVDGAQPNIDLWVERVGATVLPGPPRPILSPIELKLRFKPDERVAIYAAARGADGADPDPLVADWISILDDPRLEAVDLNSASVEGALDYLAGAGLITPERAVEIRGD